MHPKSTNLPLIVGVISPILLVMTLSPILYSWTYQVSNKEIVTERSLTQKTMLLIGLSFLILGNLCLLFKFVEKKSRVNTILASLFLFLHAVLNLSAILSFLLTKHPSFNQLIGNFYATFFASCLSLMNSVFLVIYYFKYKSQHKHYYSSISPKQRVFVFFEILVTTWCILGGIIFSYIENWPLTRGTYFSMMTITTIGFGDFRPTYTSSRIILFFYAIIGITMMGIFINSIRVVLIEHLQNKYIEKIEKMSLKKLEVFSQRLSNIFVLNNNKNRKIKLENEKLQSSEKSLRIEYQQNKILYKQLQFSIIFFLIFWMFGALIFKFTEKWTYFDAFYFCFVSFTTIGYGDITIESIFGSSIFVGYTFIGLVAAAYFIFIISEIWSLLLSNRWEKINQKDYINNINYSTHKTPSSNSCVVDFFRTEKNKKNMLEDVLFELSVDYDNNDVNLVSKIKNISRLYHHYMFEYKIENMDHKTLVFHKYKIEKCHLILEKLIEACDQKTLNSKTSDD